MAVEVLAVAIVNARDRIQGQLDRLAYLWGTGPVTIDYAQWAAQTIRLLEAAFGGDGPQIERFREAVGAESLTESQKLPLYGSWGIWERMRRAEVALRELLQQL